MISEINMSTVWLPGKLSCCIIYSVLQPFNIRTTLMFYYDTTLLKIPGNIKFSSWYQYLCSPSISSSSSFWWGCASVIQLFSLLLFERKKISTCIMHILTHSHRKNIHSVLEEQSFQSLSMIKFVFIYFYLFLMPDYHTPAVLLKNPPTKRIWPGDTEMNGLEEKHIHFTSLHGFST